MSEKEDLARLRSGSLKAFEAVLTAYEKRIFSHLLRITGNAADAADLTQETFLKVYRFRQKVDPEKNFKSWLYTIATRTAYDWLRRKNRGEEVLLPEEGETNEALPAYNSKEAELDVARALGNIRPAYRSVLLLFYAEGLTYEEIAAALALPVNTVKTHLRRGKAALKNELGYGYAG